MGSRAAFLRVGLLVIIGIGAVIGIVLFLSGRELSQGVELESYFRESVQGLDIGAPVQYLGVTLGRVTDIGLVSAEYGRGAALDIRRATYRLVYVRFVVNPRKIGREITVSGIADAVNAGLRARVATQGITGISYLSLDFLSPQEYPPLSVPWTPQYPYVPSVPSTIAQVQSAAERLSSQLGQIDFKAIAEALLGLTQELQQQLTTGEAHHTLVAATALLEDLRTKVNEADLPALTASLKKTSDAAGALAQGDQVRRLLANADRAMTELASAGRSLPPLISGLSGAVDRTNAATAELERRMTTILGDLQATAGNLRDITDALRAYPAGTIFGAPPPRGRGESGTR
jgi:ABC-type transporter Mla subunit MlaD